MELKVTEEKEDILLSRKEINAQITFKGATPSKEDIKKQLSSVLKADEKLIVIKNVFTSFGSETAKVIAYQYTNDEYMKKIEPKEKEKPKEEKKETPKEEKKEEAKEEKPKREETKKEEKKEESKKEAPKKQEKKQCEALAELMDRIKKILF